MGANFVNKNVQNNGHLMKPNVRVCYTSYLTSYLIDLPLPFA